MADSVELVAGTKWDGRGWGLREPDLGAGIPGATVQPWQARTGTGHFFLVANRLSRRIRG